MEIPVQWMGKNENDSTRYKGTSLCHVVMIYRVSLGKCANLWAVASSCIVEINFMTFPQSDRNGTFTLLYGDGSLISPTTDKPNVLVPQSHADPWLLKVLLSVEAKSSPFKWNRDETIVATKFVVLSCVCRRSEKKPSKQKRSVNMKLCDKRKLDNLSRTA